MTRFPRRSGRLATGAATFLIAAGLGLGCGSEEPSPTPDGGPAGGTLDRGIDRGEDDARRRADARKTDADPVARKAGPKSKGRSRDGSPRPSGDGRTAAESDRSRRQSRTPPERSTTLTEAEARRAARSCLERFSRATCRAMAEEPRTPSQRVEDPADCLKAMSRERCEELAAQEGAKGESVNVEKCIENPTPRCEEVLGAAYEEQVAASGGAR